MKKTASKTASKGSINSKPNAAKATVPEPAVKHVTTPIEVHHASVEVHRPISEVLPKEVKVPVVMPEPEVEKAPEEKTADSLYNEIKAAIKGAGSEKKVFLEEQIGADLSLRLQFEGFFTTNPSAATGFKTQISWS